MAMTYEDVYRLYADVVQAILDNHVEARARDILSSFPVNPIEIARALEAVYGFKIFFKPRDFYESIEDIPPARRDVYAFHEFIPETNQVIIYVNKNVPSPGEPLLANGERNFVVLKELFISVIRRDMLSRGVAYPSTVSFDELVAHGLDYMTERPSVYDIGGEDDTASVTVENAAEVLAVLFSVDIQRVYEIRLSLKEPLPLMDHSHEVQSVDAKFALFDYEKIARDYRVNVRFMVILIRSDVLDKLVTALSSTYEKLQAWIFR
jgi:hypothetical protein